jgi:sortase A
MRLLLRWTGNLLILVSLGGLGVLTYALLAPEPGNGPSGLDALRSGDDREAAVAQQQTTVAGTQAQASQDQRPNGGRSIARLAIDRAGITADVVPARLIERDGGTTWEVPAFKVGHAESTAGAGESGNAILLGHVSSLRSGNVFQDLERVELGDLVHVFTVGNTAPFDYRVVAIDRVPRADRSVLEASQTPVVSLITCTGVWLPTMWDYTERLVVRAELMSSAP